MKRVLSFLILTFIFLKADILELALSKSLHKDRYWLLLLHFNKNISEIDSKDFFINSDGKSSPKKELFSTINGFIKNNSLVCKYPARFEFLDQKLNISKYIKKPICKDLDNFLNRFEPIDSLVMSFPFSYLNSPASMYGHTLLRVDSKTKSSLLSYSINYAASLPLIKDNAILYVFKGLFGGYEGRYFIVPYYEKLKEYLDIEKRDIFEYKLNLNLKEIRRMLLHLYELQNTYSDYFFFDENCSYNLLGLIEIARPSVNLKKYFSTQVIPLDTVRALKEEGLISSYSYRPSIMKLINLKLKKLNTREQNIVLELIKKPNLKIDSKNKSIILELSVYYLQGLYIAKKISLKEYRKKYIILLQRISKLEIIKKDNIKGVDPLKGHKSNSITYYLGTKNSKSLQELIINPAYHSIDDIDIGFLKNTQANVGILKFSYYKKKANLDKFFIFDIKSFNPINKLYKPLSWQISTGLKYDDFTKKHYYNLNLSFGYTYGFLDSLYFYSLFNSSFFLSKKHFNAFYPSFGMFFNTGGSFKTGIEVYRKFRNDKAPNNFLTFFSTFKLSQNNFLKFYIEEGSKNLDRIYKLGYNLHF